MYTGRPPPSGERLDGTVSGVKALFAGLGYGTALRWAVGPAGPSTPCDSSRTGRSPRRLGTWTRFIPRSVGNALRGVPVKAGTPRRAFPTDNESANQPRPRA